MSWPRTIDSGRSVSTFRSPRLSAWAIVRLSGAAGSGSHPKGGGAGAKSPSSMPAGSGRRTAIATLTHSSTNAPISASTESTRPAPATAASDILNPGRGGMLFVLLALTPGTDVMAHLAGFASGVLLGALLSLIPEVSQTPKTNLFCGFLFALLVVVPWWLAL